MVSSSIHFLSHAKASRLLKLLATLLSSLRGQQVCIGLSGGADSSLLAISVAQIANDYDIDVSAIHVHHGLMEDADMWVEQCQQLADIIGIPLYIKKVCVDTQSGLGLEGAAREARYQAYQNLSKEIGVKHFLLAHHLNDQAETLLLRLFRGSGVLGMRGMLDETEKQGVFFHRPWLSINRDIIKEVSQDFERQYQWSPVEDMSNLDVRYKRAVVRQHLNPALNQFFPAWKENLSRHAYLMQEMQSLADDMAQLDFQTLDIQDAGKSFCLRSWRLLPPYRQSNVIRYWLSLFGLLMPSEKRLKDWLKQLREVHQLGFDREVYLKHEHHIIQVKKGRVILLKE